MNRREWLIFGGGGIIVGLISILMILCSSLSESIYEYIFARWTDLTLLITPLGFLFIAYIIQYQVPEAKGGGIPQTLLALHDEHAIYNPALSIKALVGKWLLVPAYLFGASLGYEGPIVQIGAATMVNIARYLEVTRQDILRLAMMAGGGAGLAAAFGAPLSGIVFAIEELNQRDLSAFSYAVLTAVLISGLLCETVLGHYIYLGQAINDLVINISGIRGYLIIPICGLTGGVFGSLFARVVLKLVRHIRQYYYPWYVLALAAGMVVAILNFMTHGETSGSGQNAVRAVMNNLEIVNFYVLSKSVATLATLVSGIPTGLFTPSLAIGAGFGDLLAKFFTNIQPQYLALLMMASFLSGATQAPLTSFAIVMEISGADSILAPLIASSFIAFWLSGKWMEVPLYEAFNCLSEAEKV